MGVLLGEVAYEGVKLIISVLLLVIAVFIGKGLRDMTDKRKAAKKAAEENENNDTVIQ